MTPVKQYAGDRREVNEIAVIQSYVGNPFADEYHATISGYTKIEATDFSESRKFGLPGFTDYPKEIHVLPGEYQVQLYCFKGFLSHRPIRKLTVTAGMTYLLKCDSPDRNSTLEVSGKSD